MCENLKQCYYYFIVIIIINLSDFYMFPLLRRVPRGPFGQWPALTTVTESIPGKLTNSRPISSDLPKAPSTTASSSLFRIFKSLQGWIRLWLIDIGSQSLCRSYIVYPKSSQLLFFKYVLGSYESILLISSAYSDIRSDFSSW